MDKNRIAGSTKEVTGAAKEAVGKVIGDAKLQSDGKTEKAVGKISQRRRRRQRRRTRRAEEVVRPAAPPGRFPWPGGWDIEFILIIILLVPSSAAAAVLCHSRYGGPELGASLASS